MGMRALDCVPNGKMMSTESTEVFAISLSSSSTLNEPRRDLESQNASDIKYKRRKLLYIFLVDIPLVLAVGVLIGLFEIGMLPSYRSGFYCGDPALSFLYRGDTVTTSMLMSGILLAPIVITFIVELIFTDTEFYKSSRALSAFKKTLWVCKSYFFGLIINLAIVEVMKGVTGSPRPTFFDICEPDTGIPDETCIRSEYVSTFKCTSTRFSRWLMSDASNSFPSGHTSLSVYSAIFLAWYLQRRAFNWRYRTVFLVPFVQLLCLTFAAISSLTRITDHRHHWWDVLAGFIIGIFTFAYAACVLCDNFSALRSKKDER